jgi:hypothetical protein
MKTTTAIIVFFTFFNVCLLGQNNDSVKGAIPDSTVSQGLNNEPPKPDENAVYEEGKIPMTGTEYKLAVTVLIFGLIVIILEFLLIRKQRIHSDDIIKFIIVTLVLIGVLFFVAAGYSNNQIAPAVGLFGTVTGYLLGRIQNSTNNNP